MLIIEGNLFFLEALSHQPIAAYFIPPLPEPPEQISVKSQYSKL